MPQITTRAKLEMIEMMTVMEYAGGEYSDVGYIWLNITTPLYF